MSLVLCIIILSAKMHVVGETPNIVDVMTNSVKHGQVLFLSLIHI